MIGVRSGGHHDGEFRESRDVWAHGWTYQSRCIKYLLCFHAKYHWVWLSVFHVLCITTYTVEYHSKCPMRSAEKTSSIIPGSLYAHLNPASLSPRCWVGHVRSTCPYSEPFPVSMPARSSPVGHRRIPVCCQVVSGCVMLLAGQPRRGTTACGSVWKCVEVCGSGCRNALSMQSTLSEHRILSRL